MQTWEELTNFIQAHSLPATGGATFVAAAVSALILGIALSLTYRVYFMHHDAMDGSLGRSLSLLTPALASVFVVIQTSLALSVGVLGSLAFVRFRTPVKRAEDVTFILFSLAVALLCSVGHYPLAALLVGLLLIFAWGFNLTLRRVRFRPRFAVVTINTRKSSRLNDIEQVVTPLGLKPQVVSTRTYDGITSFVLNFGRLNSDDHASMTSGLQAWDAAVQVSVFYPTETLVS